MRKSTANLFPFFEPRRAWGRLQVTGSRTNLDFAPQLKWLVDTGYPEADVILLVPDNLSPHSPAPLYEAFSPKEARRPTKKLSSTARPGVRAGSIWPRSSSVHWGAGGCVGASRAPRRSPTRARPGRKPETGQGRPSTGASPLPTPGPSCIASTYRIHRNASTLAASPQGKGRVEQGERRQRGSPGSVVAGRLLVLGWWRAADRIALALGSAAGPPHRNRPARCARSPAARRAHPCRLRGTSCRSVGVSPSLAPWKPR